MKNIKHVAAMEVQPARRKEWPSHIYEGKTILVLPKRVLGVDEEIKKLLKKFLNPENFPQPSLLPQTKSPSPPLQSIHFIPPHKLIAKKKKERKMEKLLAITEDLKKEYTSFLIG
ncbi:hypothetical protein ACLB2K_063199 [Fragaria x ananassa]